MSRSLLILIAALALAGAAVWFASPPRTARGQRADAEALPVAKLEPAVHVLAPSPPEASEQPDSPALLPASATPRREAAPTREAEPTPAQEIDRLSLATGLAVTGHVVDDLGAPLEDFVVQADRAGSEPDFHEDGELSRPFRKSGGTFRMEGFAPGVWSVWGRSKDHAESETVSVTLPGGEPIVLVVPRESVVSGRVLAPGGAPVEGASVQVSIANSRRPSYYDRPQHGATKLGLFRIDELRPGSVTLQAFAPGWAPSAPTALEVTAGETREELLLWLRPGATLLGEVFGVDGSPQPRGWVSIGDLQGFHTRLETDEQGRFQAHGLPAGEINIWADTRDGIRLQERVALREGESTRVRLAPRGALVRLFGRVSAGGEPLPNARVYASLVDAQGRPSGGSSDTRTGADGAYELRLSGSGRHGFQVYGDEEILLAWRATLDVPAAEAFEFDVAIPLGRISGRVTDADGDALAGILVMSEPERHEGGQHGSTRVLTDADGHYELRVPAGQHAVKAGADLSGFWERELPFVEARAGGLVVSENGHLRDVDFRLETGGMLEGVVRFADGTSAGRAWVAALSEGRPQRNGFCDPGGRFRIRLAPGSYLIGAGAGGTLGDQTACESVQVEIVSGVTQQVEVELAPARRVRVSILQGGRPVGCDLKVVDRYGRRQRLQSGENGTVWIGPLVPGRYTVRGQRDGKAVERVLEVTAEEEPPELELVFE